MKIAFFLGSVDISGGTYVIFQHASHCVRQGHPVTIIAQSPFTKDHLNWHPAAKELNIVHIDTLAKDEFFDLAIATWWKTALELHRLPARQYAYFVQSIESRFYPTTEGPLQELVESTYKLPLPGITEATWIKQHLFDNYQKSYHLVRNGIRKDLYHPNGFRISSRPPKGKLRVLVEGPLGVKFKNVGRTIKLARKSNATEIWLLTSSDISWIPGVDKVFSRVSIDEVAAIYRSCDVIVKLSYVEGMFGPPLEMFHCGGTAVVYDVTGHDEYIIHGNNALVMKRDDEQGIVNAINRLLSDHTALENLKKNALLTADTWPGWNESSNHFLAALLSVMDSPLVDRTQIQTLNDEAMSQYIYGESQRLKENPRIKILYKLDSILERLPKRFIHILRQLHYILESLR